MKNKHFDSGTTEADGRASAPVDPSVYSYATDDSIH